MERDDGLARKIREEIPEVDRCYQCFSCTLGCPFVFAMELRPHEIVKHIQLGSAERVLETSTLWICDSCESCATRCPNEIPIVRLMDLVRRHSVKQGKAKEREPELNRVFLDQIRAHGRINELRLVIDLKRRTGGLLRLSFDEIRLGINMLRRGKFKLLPAAIRDKKAVKRLFSGSEREK